ncbi:MAG TPA: R3H domain-containing nucleic acid-binding protein [Candidatus Limnocylindrales bacterium]
MTAAPANFEREAMDDLELLLAALPPEVVEAVHALPDQTSLIEVVLDLGRPPEARFPNSEVTLLEREIDESDIAYVIDHIGTFGDDNRAGIERTLHRISAIRNRSGKIVGLTCRIGKAVFGTIEIINDFVESGKSILIMGRPGIGKTTMLREAARVLADDLGKRVVVVDTSNEIAGDGDIPHPAIGKARRMQVRTPSLQHEVMIEAVENHMPQVIVIDEIGTELEAQAARTIAERGVQLIGTAHGNNLDNLMLNPTLSDLIGGIQSVTLGDEEARRRRSQKSVLERKQPPTFDVIIEIQDRERVMVHADVAETIDEMLRGDPVAPELRWRDEEGIHRSQSRPRPSPRETLGSERFAGLIGTGSPWRMEPGWRGDGNYRSGGYRDAAPGAAPGYRAGYRPGASGGWRQTRGGTTRETGPRGRLDGPGRPGDPIAGMMPGERFVVEPNGGSGSSRSRGPKGWSGASGPARSADRFRPPDPDLPFVAGEIADRGPLERGPLERGAPPPPERPAREARERERQAAWRDQASRALTALKADEGTAPINALELAEPVLLSDPPPSGLGSGAARLPARSELPELDDDDEEEEEDDGEGLDETSASGSAAGREVLQVTEGLLPTLRVLPFGVSRKRLEQAIRELQLPVTIARSIDEADVVMTLRNEYRSKPPTVREAEERGMPVYVLKSNTVMQMNASLTSIFSLALDPREAALRETEEAIGMVIQRSEAVELSPQSAYIRRLQHQMAERANLVSRSRGREPYRRVRLYPDQARVWR